MQHVSKHLHVDIPSSMSKLEECVQHGMREEIMEAKPCLECKTSTEAYKKIIIR